MSPDEVLEWFGDWQGEWGEPGSFVMQSLAAALREAIAQRDEAEQTGALLRAGFSNRDLQLTVVEKNYQDLLTFLDERGSWKAFDVLTAWGYIR